MFFVCRSLIIKADKRKDRFFMAMKDKMHTGELYLPGDEEILKEQEKCQERLYEFNQTRPSEGEKRQQMLLQ